MAGHAQTTTATTRIQGLAAWWYVHFHEPLAVLVVAHDLKVQVSDEQVHVGHGGGDRGLALTTQRPVQTAHMKRQRQRQRQGTSESNHPSE